MTIKESMELLRTVVPADKRTVAITVQVMDYDHYALDDPKRCQTEFRVWDGESTHCGASLDIATQKAMLANVPDKATVEAGRILVEDVVQESVDSTPFAYGGTETISSCLEDACKWYDHEEEMKRFSKEFPDVVFTLKGEGEESGDVWVKYFKDGKMQSSKAEIRLDKFDPSKLA